jgi:hypothetical protein
MAYSEEEKSEEYSERWAKPSTTCLCGAQNQLSRQYTAFDKFRLCMLLNPMVCGEPLDPPLAG